MQQRGNVPSDISFGMPNIRAPFHPDMVSFSSSEDMRLQKIKGKITGLEGDLEHLFGYVDSLSGTDQSGARSALRRAFNMGRSMSDFDHIPAAPPIGEGGELLLGPQLRHHIVEMRKVYRDIADLRNTIEGVFGSASYNHLHSVLRRERKSNTGTSITEFDIAA